MAVSDVSDTGAGATITFGTTTFAARIRSIQIGEWSIEMLDDSVLASTGFKKMIASDLKTASPVVVNMAFPTTLDLPTIGGTAETITITFPLRSHGGETTAANIAGTAQFTKIVFPTLQLGALQEGGYEFQWTGATGPTFTKAVGS